MTALIIFIICTPILGVIMAHVKYLQKWLLPFGAGLLLATILTHILPEAFEHTNSNHVGWSIVAGFALCFIVSSLVPICPHTEECCRNTTHRGITWMLIAGLFIHAILDGMAVFVFSASNVRDAMVGLTIHRAFDGVALVALAQVYHVNRQILYEWIGQIIAATCLGYFGASCGMQLPEGIMAGFVSGTMLYILSTDVIPATHKHNQKLINIVALLIGFVAVYLLAHI